MLHRTLFIWNTISSESFELALAYRCIIAGKYRSSSGMSDIDLFWGWKSLKFLIHTVSLSVFKTADWSSIFSYFQQYLHLEKASNLPWCGIQPSSFLYNKESIFKQISTVESRYSANHYTAISVITRSARGPPFPQGEISLIVRIFYSWSRQSG